MCRGLLRKSFHYQPLLSFWLNPPPTAPPTCRASFSARGQHAPGVRRWQWEHWRGRLPDYHTPEGKGQDCGWVSGSLVCTLRGNSRLRVSRKMGAFWGPGSRLLLFFFIYSDGQLPLWPNFHGTSSQQWYRACTLEGDSLGLILALSVIIDTTLWATFLIFWTLIFPRVQWHTGIHI